MESDGDIWPFSIFESMPADMFDALERSSTERSRSRLIALISRPGRAPDCGYLRGARLIRFENQLIAANFLKRQFRVSLHQTSPG